MKKTAANACPCGSGALYRACCQPYHDGLPVPTAEALMRSRYSAFALGLEPYLRASWADGHCPEENLIDPLLKWQSLRIVQCEAGGEQDEHGTVSFVARYKVNGRAHHFEECSRFVREQGQWRYLDGDVSDD